MLKNGLGRHAMVRCLKGLFVKNRRRISLTYLLSVLENFFNLLYPFVTGQAINGLLTQQGYWWLVVFVLTWTAHTIMGVLRQRYDTSVFTKIYGELATEMVETQHKQRVSDSQIVARSALTREIVDFFERDVPLVIGTMFGFFGSLVMLFCYDIQMGIACLAVLLPMTAINYGYVRRTLSLNRQLNDQLEKEAAILADCDSKAVAAHYDLVARWRIQLSNAEATNWGVLECFLILLAAFVIVRGAALSATQEAGTVYATLAYLWNYTSSLGVVPALVKQMSRLSDICDRIVVEDDGR